MQIQFRVLQFEMEPPLVEAGFEGGGVPAVPVQNEDVPDPVAGEALHGIEQHGSQPPGLAEIVPLWIMWCSEIPIAMGTVTMT